MKRRGIPPGLKKAREEARANWKNRGKPLPSEEMREEVAKAWSGKNDGTPGCLRSRRPLRRMIYVDTLGCPWCGSKDLERHAPDQNWPLGRPFCRSCHPRPGRPSANQA